MLKRSGTHTQMHICVTDESRKEVCLCVCFDDVSSDRSLGGEVSHDGDFMIFEGNRYSRKGFLFKSFAMSAVVRTKLQNTQC